MTPNNPSALGAPPSLTFGTPPQTFADFVVHQTNPNISSLHNNWCDCTISCNEWNYYYSQPGSSVGTILRNSNNRACRSIYSSWRASAELDTWPIQPPPTACSVTPYPPYPAPYYPPSPPFSALQSTSGSSTTTT